MLPSRWRSRLALATCLVLTVGCGDSGHDDGDAAPGHDGATTDGGVPGTLELGDPTVTDGEDWSLPAAVVPAPYSGLFLMGVPSDDPDVLHVGRTVYWADLNPAAGSDDFTEVRSRIDAAVADGGGLILRVKSSVTWRDSPWGDPGPFVPQWVLDDCQPARFYAAPDIEVAAPWDACLRGHYLDFVAAFGAAGLLAEPGLLGVYVHGISTSFGEELWLDEDGVAAAEAAGMTAQGFEDAFRQRISAWAAAAGDDAYKLAWVGAGWVPGYGDACDALNAHAESEGLGWRGGGLEEYHRYFGAELGQLPDADGHLERDFDWPVTAEGRYFGEEIEIWDWVPEDLRPLLYQASVMRAVQLGMSFLWTSAEALAFAPVTNHWFTLLAGKPAAESPEAVCWLREGWIHTGGQDRVWRNFEHLLMQRDLPGAQSLPAARVNRPDMYMDVTGQHYDDTARSTDVGAGQTRLAFLLEQTFLASLNGPVTVKVIYLDDTDTTWRLVAADDEAERQSAEVSGQGDGAWRTATFALSRPPVAGGLAQGADLALEVTGADDLTVRFVRVLR